MAIASSNWMFLVSMSCFIFFIHFFGCLSWFLRPVMKQCITFAGSRSLPILDTCPNHISLRCAILSTSVLSWCRVLRTVSFFISSRLVTRNYLPSHAISATRILCSSSFLRHQHSEPYNTIGTTNILVVFEIFLPSIVWWTYSPLLMLYQFFSLSFLHFPSSVMTLRRYCKFIHLL